MNRDLGDEPGDGEGTGGDLGGARISRNSFRKLLCCPFFPFAKFRAKVDMLAISLQPKFRAKVDSWAACEGRASYGTVTHQGRRKK